MPHPLRTATQQAASPFKALWRSTRLQIQGAPSKHVGALSCCHVPSVRHVGPEGPPTCHPNPEEQVGPRWETDPKGWLPDARHRTFLHSAALGGFEAMSSTEPALHPASGVRVAGAAAGAIATPRNSWVGPPRARLAQRHSTFLKFLASKTCTSLQNS